MHTIGSHAMLSCVPHKPCWVSHHGACASDKTCTHEVLEPPNVQARTGMGMWARMGNAGLVLGQVVLGCGE